MQGRSQTSGLRTTRGRYHGTGGGQSAFEVVTSRAFGRSDARIAAIALYSRAMRYVACSGFPIPVSRYFREFPAIELSDTELGLPGEGTVRRFKREAPKGHGFAFVAPKVLGESGFKKTPESKELLTGIQSLAVDLGALAVVFAAGEDFKFGKANKDTLKAFVKMVPAKVPAIVLDLPSWKTDQIGGIDDRVVPAYDPLKDAAPDAAELAYIRLPGPAGHRSRYDEAAIERLLEHLAGRRDETTFCVFRNIDMYANASAVLKKWK